MSKELIVSSTVHETKVAILEDDELVEVFFEREKQFGLAGSIYKGRVTRVLPGMQSAFVNIGLDRDAFLYVSDFLEDTEEYDRIVTTAEDKVLKMEEKGQLAPAATMAAAAPPSEPSAEQPPEELAPEQEAAGPELPPRYIDSPPDRWGGAGAAERWSGAGQERWGGGSRGRGRRGRGRRGGRMGPGRGFPESKFAHRPEPARYERERPRRPAPPESGEEAGGAFEVLPGESLAKYSRSTPEPPSEETPVIPVAAGEEETEESAFEELRLDNRLEHSMPEMEAEASEPERPAQAPSLAAQGLAGEPAAEPPAAASEAESAPEAAPPETAAETTAAPAAIAGPAPEIQVEEAAAPEEPAAEPPQAQEAEGDAQPREASLREGAYGRRYLQRSHRLRRGRGRGGRDRGRERPVEPAEEAPAAGRAETSITDLLKPGQEVLVQIAKEPIGKKGARITSHIALPGRYLVYMPTVDHVGVSRKIQSDQERARLKRVVQEHRNGMPGGFIVRTAGEGHTDDEIRSDMDFLYNLWLDLRAKAEQKPAPALIHHDLNLVERILRDQLTETFKTIWVDTQEDYERILQFVERFQPELVGRVKLYTRATPIFDEFGITQELEKALRPKVWLKSGGYIVINQTEALVAIDVNTGKFVGKSNRLEDTIVKTNLDAVKEIVRQIRLRDLGGIIVVDFIDMDERKNRQKVMQALDEALREDRAPSKILQFNDFGLVAITRKRVKQSLERTLCTPCPYCDGAGYVKSVETMVLEILTEAKKIARTLETGSVTLRVNPELARVLKSRENRYLEELEGILRRPVLVKGDPQLHQEKFDFN